MPAPTGPSVSIHSPKMTRPLKTKGQMKNSATATTSEMPAVTMATERLPEKNER